MKKSFDVGIKNLNILLIRTNNENILEYKFLSDIIDLSKIFLKKMFIVLLPNMVTFVKICIKL